MKKQTNTNAKTNANITSAGIVREKFESIEALSLRKIAVSLGLTYNMLLKASKQPQAGQVYDPQAINYDAVELYMRKKLREQFDEIDWDELAAASTIVRIAKPSFEVGATLKLRGDDRIYKVELTTATHIVIMEVDGTQPRVFSWTTFEHQGPRKAE